MKRLAVADAVMLALQRRARAGSTWLGRLGDIAQTPPIWAALAAVLALCGGLRGKRAALRGDVCYGVAAVVANVVINAVVGRSRRPGAGAGRPGPIGSSFPSGHTATDLAFSPDVAEEIPVLLTPHRRHDKRPLVDDPQSRALPDRRARRRSGRHGSGGSRVAALAAPTSSKEPEHREEARSRPEKHEQQGVR